MDNKAWVWVVVVIVILVGGFVYYNNYSSPANLPDNTPNGGNNPPVSSPKEWTVATDGTTFNPKELTIKKGDTVTWKNEGESDVWPASATHPTHMVYPGSDIKKCGTAEEGAIFDACHGMKKGESWSFKFNEVGEWGYHDHMQTTVFGKIIVTE